MPWFLIPAPVTHRPSFPTAARWLSATPWLRSSMGHWPGAGRGQTSNIENTWHLSRIKSNFVWSLNRTSFHDALKMGLHSSIDMMKWWNDMKWFEMKWNNLPLETSALGLPGFTCTFLKKWFWLCIKRSDFKTANPDEQIAGIAESPRWNSRISTYLQSWIPHSSRSGKTWKKTRSLLANTWGIHQQKFLLPIFPHGNPQKSPEISDIFACYATWSSTLDRKHWLLHDCCMRTRRLDIGKSIACIGVHLVWTSTCKNDLLALQDFNELCKAATTGHLQ